MYNPYTLFTTEILMAMTRQPMYFVRQYYTRGSNHPEDKSVTPLLLTHYIHHEVDTERANRHMRLLFKDHYRSLYDSTKTEHMEKLKIAASQPDGYRVYINLLPKQWKASDAMKTKINLYMQNKLPWWRYSPADKLKVNLKERYGELYLGLLWKGHQAEVNLEEIENFSLCAMT